MTRTCFSSMNPRTALTRLAGVKFAMCLPCSVIVAKRSFLNSHLLSEVEQLCTSVAILNKGKKIQEGAVDDLTRIETHFDLITTPISEQLLAELSANFTISKLDRAGELSTYRLAQADRTALNQIIDTLRQHNVEIDEVRPMRQSLEERFVAEVTVDN